jgi:hypothetical protein
LSCIGDDCDPELWMRALDVMHELCEALAGVDNCVDQNNRRQTFEVLGSDVFRLLGIQEHRQ